MNELALLSLLLSMVYTELTGLTPGGIIVPFYFVLYIDAPEKLLATLLTALLCLGVVRLLSGQMILYGRRRFAVFLLAGIVLKMAVTWLWVGDGYLLGRLSMTIGFLIPGILAGNMERQGVVKTVLSLAAVVLLIRVSQIVLTGG